MSETRASSPCPQGFPEDRISGYLDHVLTQGEAQRVRLHLDECSSCRRLYADLALLRDAARGTRFEVPDDDQWKELPRGGGSRLLRTSGWVLAILTLVVAAGLGLVHLARSTASGGLEAWLGWSALGGFTLLLLSVVVDRLRSLGRDRYRRVQK